MIRYTYDPLEVDSMTAYYVGCKDEREMMREYRGFADPGFGLMTLAETAKCLALSADSQWLRDLPVVGVKGVR